MFFLPRKKIVLNTYTSRVDVYENSRIRKASAFLPQWWRSLAPTYKNPIVPVQNGTMKYCAGFNEHYRHGFMMPMWSDLAVEVGPIGSESGMHMFVDGVSTAVKHPIEQRGFEYLPEDHYTHLKLESPWVFHCDEDVKWHMAPAFWNFENPAGVFIPPATVEYKYQHGTHVNMFLQRQAQPHVYRFDHGQPLVHFVPLSERPVELRIHLKTQPEMQIISAGACLKFVNTYGSRKKAVIQNEAEAKKCPFSFFR